MEYVKFKGNTEPCLKYKVLTGEPTPEFDEVRNEYCMCIEVAVLGWVDHTLFDEAVHPDSPDAMDLAIKLTND